MDLSDIFEDEPVGVRVAPRSKTIEGPEKQRGLGCPHAFNEVMAYVRWLKAELAFIEQTARAALRRNSTNEASERPQRRRAHRVEGQE